MKTLTLATLACVLPTIAHAEVPTVPCDGLALPTLPPVAFDTRCVAPADGGMIDPIVESSWRFHPTFPGHHEVIATPVVANLTDDNGDGKIDAHDVPDIVVTTFAWSAASDPGTRDYDGPGTLTALTTVEGSDHLEVVWAVQSPGGYDVRGSAGAAVGDLDGNGRPEICTGGVDVTVICVEVPAPGAASATPGLRWAAGPGGGDRRVAIADLDGDGFAEVMAGSQLFRHDGSTVTGGMSTWDSGASFAVDFDLDGELELVDGPRVYDLVTVGPTTALATPGSLSGQIDAGYAAVGDFDEDRRPELVVVAPVDGTVQLIDPDGDTDADTLDGWTISLGGGTRQRGGPPVVADLDGDGAPEIGVASAFAFIALDTDGETLWQHPISATGPSAGASVFDIDGNGAAEVLFADGDRFVILDGASGSVLWQATNHSGRNLSQYPVVADVDGDGDAEIILASNSVDDPAGWSGITVFGSATDTWAPARPVWNQHAYDIANIDDDAGIPKRPARNWMVWNTFRAAGTNLGPAHWRADLGTGWGQACLGPCADYTVDVYLQVQNFGQLPAPDVEVHFYRDHVAPSNFAMAVSVPLVEGVDDAWLGPVTIDRGAWGDGNLLAVATPPEGVLECNEDNNRWDFGAWPYAITDLDNDYLDVQCDNCPSVANPSQADTDADGLGDACDPCTDIDQDAFGDVGFPATTCPIDNCPADTNPDQLDADGDGMGDVCDSCTDRDGDGAGDPGFKLVGCPLDNCPDVPNPDQQDSDLNGLGDACQDIDGDQVIDIEDNCPTVPNPTQADFDENDWGDACQDTDDDQIIDIEDNCPHVDNATQADADGDGVGDLCQDNDDDGVLDIEDNCPAADNPQQEDSDGNGIGDACQDVDADEVIDIDDNCPDVPNPDQADVDADGQGDLCQDRDDDGVLDVADNCHSIANADQADTNADGVGDACSHLGPDTDGDGFHDSEDNCPTVPNADQTDSDGDGVGDVCQDADQDGVIDLQDNCVGVPNAEQTDWDGNGIGDACQDLDRDGIVDVFDNCLDVANPMQTDADIDGLGDLCDPALDLMVGGGGCHGASREGPFALALLCLVLMAWRCRRRQTL